MIRKNDTEFVFVKNRKSELLSNLSKMEEDISPFKLKTAI